MKKEKREFKSFATAVCWVLFGLTTTAQAFDGVIEIHGQVTSPSCDTRAMQWTAGQLPASLNGQTCGVTSSLNNPLALSAVAQVGEETYQTASASASSKRTVTLTYR